MQGARKTQAGPLPEVWRFMGKVKEAFLKIFTWPPTAQAWTLSSPAAIWIIALVVGPLLIVLVFSFLTNGPYGTLIYEATTENYGACFNWLYLKVLLRTLMIATLSTVLCILIAYPVVYWLTMHVTKWRAQLLFFIILPFWTSYLIRIYSWMFLLKDTGFINGLLLDLHLIATPKMMLYSWPSVMLCLVYTWLPFMIMPLYSSLEKLDRSVLEAATDLGASPFWRFVKVTLPLTKGGIISGSLLVFMPSVGAYIVPELVGGAKVTMLGNLIRDKFVTFRNWPLGSALSIILLFIVLLLIYYYMKAVGKKEAFKQLT